MWGNSVPLAEKEGLGKNGLLITRIARHEIVDISQQIPSLPFTCNDRQANFGETTKRKMQHAGNHFNSLKV